MDTLSLKKKILDIAISGKLSNQNLRLESAERDYAELKQVKSNLLKSKQAKKEKVAPNTNDDLLFDIPQNWKWCQLADLCKSVTDGTHKTPTYIENGVPFLSVKNISSGRFDFDDVKYISFEEHEELIKRCKPEFGDILFCRIGTLGKAIEVDFDRTFSIFVSLGLIKPLDTYLSKYLVLVLNSGYVDLWIRNNKAGDSMHAAKINLNTLRSLMIPLPPKEEQERIVNRLEKIIEKIDLLNEHQSEYMNNLETLKSKLYDAGIQGKLTEQLPDDGNAEDLYIDLCTERNQILKIRKGRADKNIKDIDENVPYLLPENWKWIRFGEVGLFKKGPFGSALTKSMFVPKSEDTIKVYEQQHAIQKDSTLGTYYITKEYFEDKMSGFEVLPGDVLVSCAGTIGETYILPSEIERGIINQALMRVTLAPSINKRFFQLYFDANLKKAAQEESNGSAIKNIPPFNVMKNWYFPLPPLSEQERIVEKIDSLLSIIEMRG